MLAPGDAQSIAELCRNIGNEVSDESGFVPVRNLLSRFNAHLVIRPLLVEGMLASINPSDNAGHHWAVLLDAETYPFSHKDVEDERPTRSLPHRMRNTIAHELVHSLAFRPSEFGLRLKARTDTKDGVRELLQALEQETEQFSPLLLWSERALRVVLTGRKEQLTLSDLKAISEQLGISKYVLINRLRLIRPASDSNGFLFLPTMRNIGVGIGVWGATHAYIKGWPIFFNFDDVVPSFLLKASSHERLPADTVLSDPSFAMLGGPKTMSELETGAGTYAAPDAKRMRIRISMEEGLRRQGEEFLFVVHGVAVG